MALLAIELTVIAFFVNRKPKTEKPKPKTLNPKWADLSVNGFFVLVLGPKPNKKTSVFFIFFPGGFSRTKNEWVPRGRSNILGEPHTKVCVVHAQDPSAEQS